MINFGKLKNPQILNWNSLTKYSNTSQMLLSIILLSPLPKDW